LAQRAHALGLKTVHYISPKVWVWNKARIPKMAACLDRLITIFPFEAECFSDTSLPVSFAGHPLVDRARETREAPPVTLPWGERHRVALLPGSRAMEIQRLLPLMLEAANQLERQCGPCSFMIPAPTDPAEGWVREILDATDDKPDQLHVVRGHSQQVLLQAKATLVASGTATLEASLMECPMVIVYRTAALTYLVGRLLVRGVKHIGLVNIIAGRTVCTELIQRDFTPAAAVRELAPLLTETPRRQAMLEAMSRVNAALGEGGTGDRAAAAVLETIGEA
jgi:lipid-A-disaccharide synthase